MMFEIKYSHDYYKMDWPTHTTIRGFNWSKKKEIYVGAIVKETFPSKTNISEILDIWTEPIKNLSLEMLKEDGEYPGHPINSHQEFCDLINSFYPKFYVQCTLDSVKTVIHLIYPARESED